MGAKQDLFQSLNLPSSSDLFVLEEQRARVHGQQSFLAMDSSINFSYDVFLPLPDPMQSLQLEEYPFQDLANAWPNLTGDSTSDSCSFFQDTGNLSSFSSCSLKRRRDCRGKKRELEKPATHGSHEAELNKGMKPETEVKNTKRSNKGEAELAGKVEASPENPRDDAVPPLPPKKDFIHVRARRGQATDSHSLAERVRRERISERMKYLERLVPGCNKITGKAGMLDEIINYVKSLQRQVEFLSMKLATVNPSMDLNVGSFFHKEGNMACDSSVIAVDVLREMMEASYLHLNPIDQVTSYDGFPMNVNEPGTALPRMFSAPVSVPDPFLGPSYNNSTWDASSKSISCVDFHQGRGSLSPLQTEMWKAAFSGCLNSKVSFDVTNHPKPYPCRPALPQQSQSLGEIELSP
ncbi:hypothetical protein HPP92_008153 [Vanilla planifolia]|uniref:BHLH domain-containing protein n=1 Tax=Vanilla planifolia TaxID=51239 RepID=A0A835R957_VANPL|nr:hypothetical protein HPP92_008153 [Vanilla planifolia]